MLANLVLVSSLLYFCVIYTDSLYVKYLLKPTTTLLIIGVGLESDNVRNNAKLAGLVFSLLGDIFLMFTGEDMFILGLSSFLTAHIFYIYMFYNTKKRDQASALFGLLSIASVYFSFLYPSIFQEGGIVMTVAVAVYIIVITFMVYYALMNDNTNLSIGVFLFFISDATLALDKFLYHAPDRRYIISLFNGWFHSTQINNKTCKIVKSNLIKNFVIQTCMSYKLNESSFHIPIAALDVLVLLLDTV